MSSRFSGEHSSVNLSVIARLNSLVAQVSANDSDIKPADILMGLLSATPSHIPSILKFIYPRELTEIVEYLKMYGIVWQPQTSAP